MYYYDTIDQWDPVQGYDNELTYTRGRPEALL
jgi:hypothetical protein